MFRNMLSALYWHLVIVFFSLILMVALLCTIWMVAPFPVTLLALLSYVLIGRKFRGMGSRGKNFASMLSPALFGIMVWCICLFVELSNHLGTDGMDPIMFFYYVLSPWSLSLFLVGQEVLGISTKFVSMASPFFAFLPSLLMWIGLERKVKREKKAAAAEALQAEKERLAEKAKQELQFRQISARANQTGSTFPVNNGISRRNSRWNAE